MAINTKPLNSEIKDTDIIRITNLHGKDEYTISYEKLKEKINANNSIIYIYSGISNPVDEDISIYLDGISGNVLSIPSNEYWAIKVKAIAVRNAIHPDDVLYNSFNIGDLTIFDGIVATDGVVIADNNGNLTGVIPITNVVITNEGGTNPLVWSLELTIVNRQLHVIVNQTTAGEPESTVKWKVQLEILKITI